MEQPLQSFFDLFGSCEMSQPQREATLQLLIWTMLVDKSIKISEQNRIHAFLEHIEWTSPFQIREFWGLSVARIRDVMGDAEKEKTLITRLREILDTPEICQRAIAACVDLARADNDLSIEEQNFLTRLGNAFREEKKSEE